MKRLISILVFFTTLSVAGQAFGEVTKDFTSDTWLESKLSTMYLFNKHLGPFEVGVEVRDHVAYLSGVVDSEIEKDLAEEIAKSVDGITKVENKLVVDKAKSEMARRQPSSNRSFGQKIDDISTTASIKSKMLANTNVAGLGINVDTVNAVVTLTGTVKSSAESSLAEQLAKNTAGVHDVRNKLRVTQ